MESISYFNPVTYDERLPPGYEIKLLPRGTILSNQYEAVSRFQLLVSGEISFHVNVIGQEEKFLVSSSEEQYTPIGWGGLNPPFRYNTTCTVISDDAQLLVWEIDQIRNFIKDSQNLDFLQFLVEKSSSRVDSLISKLDAYSHVNSEENSPISESESVNIGGKSKTILTLYRKSPFFSPLSEKLLKELAKLSEKLFYLKGDTVYSQNEDSHGLYILGHGKTDLVRSKDSHNEFNFRSISTPGFIIGWSGLANAPNPVTARVREDSTIYLIPLEAIRKLVLTDLIYGKDLYKRILWFISIQLQVASSRRLALKQNHELALISNLIHSNRPKFSVFSELLKIPHLLNHRETIGDAIGLLKELNENGNYQEQHLSSLTLDLLENTRKEHQFYTRLKSIYSAVAESAKKESTESLRASCSLKVQEAFEFVPVELKGLENLPKNGGNIIIYNHLRNHPEYTLPNDFQITLDSHFISSEVLFPYYGDPGVRVVRIPKSEEFAHQNYYHPLGYLNVWTPDSSADYDQEIKRIYRKKFYQEAQKILSDGKNILISPEGISRSTEESPGKFKMGAFKLALNMEIEPWITPVAIVDFDRRIIEGSWKCHIQKPFKLSHLLSSRSDDEELKSVVNKLQDDLSKEIRNLSDQNKY